ncbi:MAG TPA: pilus assembly protein TadG-related protein [Bacillota bacterium]|nr:pilus assembly protein TadG-related protein [Bacillota bacterium]
MNAWYKEEKGSIMVLFALLLVFMIGLVGMAADAGLVYHHRSILQNAADAAALAGAYQLPNTMAATNVATAYSMINGIKSGDILTVTFPSANRVCVNITRNVKLNFVTLLGIKSFNVAVKATGRVLQGGTAFDYALFSGSPDVPLEINGGTEIISGNGHSNSDTVVKGSDLTITNNMDMVGTFTGTGTKINIGTIIEHYKFLPTPDFSSLIINSSSTVYNTSQTFDGNVNVSGNLYAQGDVTFNGGSINGLGTVLSTGGITINGDLSYNSANDGVCLYSQNGDVTINGGQYGSVIHGIIYAPNGNVTFNGAKVTIYGAIIAKTVTWNGVKVDISYDAHAVTSIPNTDVQLVE